MNARKRIALYGGTFDPIHLGHLEIARKVLELFEIEKVLFVPAQAPPHKIGRPVTEPIHRYAMLALANAVFSAARDLAGRRVAHNVPGMIVAMSAVIVVLTGALIAHLTTENWVAPAQHHVLLLGGAGFFRHFDRFGLQRLSFASNEGTFTAGGGARVWMTPRVYIGAEARVGWELHTRVAGTVSVQLGR